MALLTHKIIPPGGWIYDQKDVSGVVLKQFRSMSPFTDAVGEILKFRQLNRLSCATALECATDLDAATCARLGSDGRYCSKKNS
jgi:hypothetical protein